jgi:UDP-N-acetylmuramate dehydrogenase
MRLDALAARSVEQGSDALVFASGIPGTVGGAVCGNAGAFGCRISDVLVEVRLLDEQDTDCWCSAEQLGFGYRRSRLQRGTAVVLEARFRCAVAAGPDAASRRRGEILRLRRDKHPDWRTLPCAGSVFRNLEQAEGARRIAAGKLLEQAGAAGMHHGGVRVYEKHANIIVRDRADASAQDVHDLALRMYQAVRRMHRVSLVPEIHFLGAFEHTPDTVKWIKKE